MSRSRGYVPPDQVEAWCSQLSRPDFCEFMQLLCTRHPLFAEELCDFVMLAVSRRKIFVRRLSFEYDFTFAFTFIIDFHEFDSFSSTSSETLHRLFSEFGTVVEAAVIYDKFTKRSKGFGKMNFSHIQIMPLILFRICHVC